MATEGKPSTRGGVRHLEVGAQAGQRIDNFLARELKGVPRSRIYRMLRRGEVRLNGRRVGPDARLAAGDRVRIPPVDVELALVVRAPDQLLARLETRLLYTDEKMIVLDKPAGLAVHGGSGVRLGVIEAVRQLYPGATRLELAHRIDRDTSGVLLIARTRPALLALHAAFREGRVAKRYDALVHGQWPRRTRTVRSALERYVTEQGERRVRPHAERGKAARTDFEVAESCATATWIRAFPHTGRTHQIRVHCRQAGHPIVGDEKYSSDTQLGSAHNAGVTRLCLHATSIRLEIDGKALRFEAPLPDDFESAWRSLCGDASTSDRER
jgi:23S rRNA pseudouridine955/2504/2580 synthase